MQASTLRRWLPWLVKLAVSASLIVYLLANVGLEGAWSRVTAIPPLLLVLAMVLLALQTVIWALRWTLVIRGMGLDFPVRESIPITFAGLFLNQFLPASIGADVVRMWLSRRAGLPISKAVNSVFVERVGTFLTVCALAAATSGYWAGILKSEFAVLVFPLVTLAGIGAVGMLAFVDRLPRRWFERHRLLRGVIYLSEDTRRVFLNPRHTAVLAALATLGQAMLALTMFALASGLGTGLTLLQCFVLMPPVVVISSLPISVAGWGVRELVIITALDFMGVPADVALLLSLILAVLVLATSLPGGLLWLARRPRADG